MRWIELLRRGVSDIIMCAPAAACVDKAYQPTGHLHALHETPIILRLVANPAGGGGGFWMRDVIMSYMAVVV